MTQIPLERKPTLTGAVVGAILCGAFVGGDGALLGALGGWFVDQPVMGAIWGAVVGGIVGGAIGAMLGAALQRRSL